MNLAPHHVQPKKSTLQIPRHSIRLTALVLPPLLLPLLLSRAMLITIHLESV
jgi:hypothetical protein